MKKILLLLFCLALMLSLCCCGDEAEQPDEAPHESQQNSLQQSQQELPQTDTIDAEVQSQCSVFMNAIAQGDWKTVQEKLPLGGLASSSTIPKDGIMQELFQTMTYELTSTQQQSDGSVLVTMKINNVDMKSLLEALPEDTASKEEAREKMIELSKTATRKDFDAQLTLIPVEGQDEMDIQIDTSFGNALTGGMYDLYAEMMEAVINEENA